MPRLGQASTLLGVRGGQGVPSRSPHPSPHTQEEHFWEVLPVQSLEPTWCSGPVFWNHRNCSGHCGHILPWDVALAW